MNLIKLSAFGIVIAALALLVFNPFRAEATRYEQLPDVTICHCEGEACETKEVSALAAYWHLKQHEADYRGACKEGEPTATPTASPTATPSATPTVEPTKAPTVVNNNSNTMVVEREEVVEVTVPNEAPATGRGGN